MGLISDYLEQCRSRSTAGDLDPCMIIGEDFKRKINSYQEIYRTLNEYTTARNNDQKLLIRQQLIARSSELETIKTGYLLGEKIVLSVWNSGKLQSPLMIDTIQLLLAELRRSYQAICTLRQSINRELKENTVIQFEAPSEIEIRRNMLKTIGSSVLAYLQNPSVLMGTSEFRKVIFDQAEIVRYFEQEQYNQPAKKVVQYYFEKDLHLKSSHIKCANCGNLLLQDIPYCLNCYERN